MDRSELYESAVAITPSDTVGFAKCNAIYVGGAGNLVVICADGRQITLNGALAGHIIPIQATRVNSTSTTATNLVALY